MPLLHTFVQISDLHIDRAPLAERAQRFQDRLVRLVVRYVPYAHGYAGHDPNALIDLESFVAGLRYKLGDRAVTVLHTGDLTAGGHPEDFLAGMRFLSPGKVANDLEPSVEQSDWRGLGVPGNHDEWPGRVPHWFGLRAAERDHCFPAPFWIGRSVFLAPVGKRLRLIGLDGDSDNPPGGGLNRFLARGSFAGSLTDLSRVLGTKPDYEVRVLLLHHSPSWTGRSLGIDESSRVALGSFLAEQGISLILTGHLHSVSLGGQPFSGVNTRELRCGTSAQLLKELPNWRVEGVRVLRKKPEPHSVLVHRLEASGGGLEWETTVWARERVGMGFERVQGSGAQWRTRLV